MGKVILVLAVLSLLGFLNYYPSVVGSNNNYEIIRVTVGPGDTAWSLCVQANGGNVDPRRAVHVFRQLNDGIQIRAGNVVKVPVF